MIRDIITVTIVSLSLFGTVSQQDGNRLALKILAATGDGRRSMAEFLDLYAGLKAGVPHAMAARQQGASELAVES